jgi:predicted NBD/HSP70 family sugar kinase
MSIISVVIPSTAVELRRAGLVRALRAVHAADGQLTRARLARELGCTRATAAALVADLAELGLVTEGTAAPSGRRGRPSTALAPAPGGPVVVVLEIAVDAVRDAAVRLGGRPGDVRATPLASQEPDRVLAVARTALRERVRAAGRRCAGVAISMYGIVEQPTGVVSSAPNLGWDDVDVLPRLGVPPDLPVLVDNVAHLSALADARRGRGRGLGCVLYLHAAVGLGGALVLDGSPLRGRRGFAGEYGHLPLGKRGLPCRCGARGCWETEVDQLALARAAGSAAPSHAAAATAAALLARAGTDAQARHAVHEVARGLGRGIGALVNAHDPDLVVLAGHAAAVLDAAPDVVRDAAGHAALRVHRGALPPIVPTAFGEDGGLLGAAESLFDRLLEDPVALATRTEDGS